MVDLTGPLRNFNVSERSDLFSEVRRETPVGRELVEKIRRFCSYHRSYVSSVSKKKFGSDSKVLLVWMYDILAFSLAQKRKSNRYSVDPAILNALLHLSDALKVSEEKRAIVNCAIEDLFRQVMESTYEAVPKELCSPFHFEKWYAEASSSKKIVIFCPNPYSLYTSAMIHLCAFLGVEVTGVVVRKFTYSRFFGELKRDGIFRLFKKIVRKLVLRSDENREKSDVSLKKLHNMMTSQPPNIYRLCKSSGIEIISVDEYEQCSDWLRQKHVDIGIFTGGGMVTHETLGLLKIGMINVHMGVLPQYKGMDVVQGAILENEYVGLTAHIMSSALDAGPIINTFVISPWGYPSLGNLRNTMSTFSPLLAIDSMLGLFSGRLSSNKQEDGGRIYYVMHPALMSLTDRLLKSKLQRNKRAESDLCETPTGLIKIFRKTFFDYFQS